MGSKLEKDQDHMSYQALLDKNHSLEAEVKDLKIRLEEAEELRRAISEGDLDALIIRRPEEELVFTLDSADRAYRVLVETMNEGTATLASDGTILYCNRQFSELTKMPSRAVIGTSIYGVIAPEDATTFKALLKQQTSARELRLRAQNGTSVPVYMSISSLQSEGSPNAWCLVVTDLTEQKKNEEIVAAERLARSIIEQAAEAIVVCDTTGRITHFSNTVPKVCKCDPAFKTFEDIIDIRFLEGGDAGKSILPVSSALKGDTLLGIEAILELEECQKSHTKMHLLLNSGPLKNADGKIIGCVVTLTDITERRKAEEALRESEEISRQRLEEIENLYRNAPIGLCELDRELRYVRINERLAEINGLPVTAHIGKRVRDVLPQSIAYMAEPQMLRVLETGKPLLNIEIVGETLAKPGIERSWIEQWLPITDAQGFVTGLNIAVEETTERKKMERELQESEEKYRNIIETANEGIWIVDPEARTTYVNKRMAEMLGFTQEEMIGRSPRDFTDEESTTISIQNMKKRQPDINESREFKLTSKDGSSLWTLTNAKSLFDKDGRFTGSMSMLTDITERKEAEVKLKETLDNLENLVRERTEELEKAYSSLKESEKGLSEAQKMAHLGNWYRNLITDKIYWSDEMYRIFGFRPQEFEVNFDIFLNYVHPEDRIYVENNFKKALKGEPYSNDYRIITANGTERIIHSQGEIVFDKKNITIGMRGTIQDITERKMAEEVLEKMDKIRIKEIHHRIKNNLQVICSLLSLEAERFSDEKMLEAFKESQNRVASMALIHEELYRGNKSDTLDFAAYLNKFTKDLFSSYNLGNNNVSLKTDLEQVYLDMDAAVPLGIIVNELISNSLKHAFPAERKGEIHISLLRTDAYDIREDISDPEDCREKGNFQYMLRVMDNGRGIPEEIEIENADSLGLQLVNILVDQIDGCIELKRNCGTDFTIWFGNKEP